MSNRQNDSKKRQSNTQKIINREMDGESAERLLSAWEVPEENLALQQAIHLFHPYPGRFHSHLAATLLQTQNRRHYKHVLDPFMGSGTSIVAALQLGIKPTGCDLNPISWLVVQEKTKLRKADEAEQVLQICKNLREKISGSQNSNLNISRQNRIHGEWLQTYYDPHLYMELLAWINWIDNLAKDKKNKPQHEAAATLRAVFSSLVTKFSVKLSDSSEGTKQAQFRKGAVSEWMERKTEELLRNQVSYTESLPKPQLIVDLFQSDILKWQGPKLRNVDCILTSPPYPGTYDYAEHHQLRLRWLGWNDETFFNQELAPRRGKNSLPWHVLYQKMLQKMAVWSAPQADLYMVIGDWVDRQQAVSGREFIKGLSDHPWQLKGWASVQREVFFNPHIKPFAKTGKWEHILYFSK